MAGNELEDRLIEDRLIEDAHKLSNPPFAVDELLSILDKAEASLSKVNQKPNGSMVAALSPLRIVLVSDKLLRHRDADVKIHVAACLTEFIRITAPESPYGDENMKEIFHLIVVTFYKLTHLSSCCYLKVVSILETIAKTRAVVLMMDLDCDALINEMFGLFLMITRSNNSDDVSTSMVTIMTIVISESDDISSEIVIPLLGCVRKENQNFATASRKVGKEVIENCSTKIGPYILRAVKNLGFSMDNYDEVVVSICEKEKKNLKSFDSQRSEELLINDDTPTIRCFGEEKTKGKITSENAKLEETEDKGQFEDIVGSGSHNAFMQQPASAKTRLDHEIRSQASEDALLANSGQTDVTLVQGYEVKTAMAPILTAIFAKYGDLAAYCKYKSSKLRGGLLEIVSDIVGRLQTSSTPLAPSEIEVLKNEMKGSEGADLKLSRLKQPLGKMSEVEKIAEMHSTLKSVKANCMMVIKAATRELEEALMELVALQKRMGETEKQINAMKLVVQQVDDVEDQELLWLKQISKLPY